MKYLLISVLLVLSACGGGDPEDLKRIDPPLCETNPELCR